MKKVCIQAGHKGRTTGATGATGERDWNTATVNKLKELLSGKVEVYTTGADDYKTDSTVTNTDWDLFLSVHYDADIYNDRGGFTGYPEPSTDHATKDSVRLANSIGEYFFNKTGIPWKKQRSTVANIRYYYMWKYLSAKTPCVIIECGVGWRKPEDYETLRKDSTPEALAEAILVSLGIDSGEDDFMDKNVTEDDCEGNRHTVRWYMDDWCGEKRDKEKLEQKLDDMEKVLESYRGQVKDLEDENKALDEELGNCRTRVLGLEKERGQLEAELVEKEKTIKTIKQENVVLKKDNIKLSDELAECQNSDGLCSYSSWSRVKSLFTCPKGGE